MATTNYPGSLDAYPVPNSGDNITVANHWLGPATIAIETELGTDPAGSFTDVKSRLNDTDDKVITEIDQWLINSTYTASDNALVAFGSTAVRANVDSFTHKGTGLTYDSSNSKWTFPSTGYYKIDFHALVLNNGSASPEIYMRYNASYAARAYVNVNGKNASLSFSYIAKVSTSGSSGDYFDFWAFTNYAGTIYISGDNHMITSGFNCTRLGDI